MMLGTIQPGVAAFTAVMAWVYLDTGVPQGQRACAGWRPRDEKNRGRKFKEEWLLGTDPESEQA